MKENERGKTRELKRVERKVSLVRGVNKSDEIDSSLFPERVSEMEWKR